MCLLALAWRADERWPLALIGNRDELHARPTARAARWDDPPQVIGGKDLKLGGAWLGVSERGRLAAVTNVRRPHEPAVTRASRGLLTRRFLTGELDLEALQALDLNGFNPFNLIVIENDAAVFMTNRPQVERLALAPGLHGLSNGPLQPPWPKTRRAIRALSDWLGAGSADPEPLFAVLADERPAPDADLPDSGVGLERERQLSACFLRGPIYGTRASTVILVDARGRGLLIERSFGPNGAPAGEARVGFNWSGDGAAL
jgi:uncharacterized protein with NRDE domain